MEREDAARGERREAVALRGAGGGQGPVGGQRLWAEGFSFWEDGGCTVVRGLTEVRGPPGGWRTGWEAAASGRGAQSAVGGRRRSRFSSSLERRSLHRPGARRLGATARWTRPRAVAQEVGGRRVAAVAVAGQGRPTGAGRQTSGPGIRNRVSARACNCWRLTTLPGVC